MQLYQKLYINGYQCLLFPMEVMNITQTSNTGTHMGTNAIDNAGLDSGKDLLVAPCDIRLVGYDTNEKGNALFFESLSPVLFRDNSLDYATFMFVHSDDVSFAKNQVIFSQGDPITLEGSSGYGRGNHIHMEVAKGRYKGMYVENEYGIYSLPDSMPCDLAFFLDGTYVFNNGGLYFWTSSYDLFN